VAKKRRAKRAKSTKRRTVERKWDPRGSQWPTGAPLFPPAPARKTLGDGPFTRLVGPPTHAPEGTAPDWRAWGRRRGGRTFGGGGTTLGPVPIVPSQEQRDELAAMDVFHELTRLDVDPFVAQEIAEIDRDRWYAVVVTVKGGSGSAGAQASERKGGYATNRVVLVGTGVRLWGRFMHLADPDGGGSEVLDVEVHELQTQYGDRPDAFPLWSEQTVTVKGGALLEGAGRQALWMEWHAEHGTKKRGRKKKSGGSMNATERRKYKAAERARKARAKKTQTRRRALEDAGDAVAGRRLTKRRLAGLKGRTTTKPGKGRTR
jgi:hypothetical protein